MSDVGHLITNERLVGEPSASVGNVGGERASHDVCGEVEPAPGIEPGTCSLRKSRSTTELSGLGNAPPTTPAPARQESHRRRYRPRGESLTTRVSAQLDTSGGLDACWPWLGRINPDGYGVVDHGHDQYLVHRAVLESVLGRELGRDEVSRHRCHNRPCGNPRHLQPGTPADNRADMIEAGRQPRGEDASGAKLTEEQVIKIRQMAAVMGWGKYELLGRSFGVTGKQISNIVKGRRWAHVGASR